METGGNGPLGSSTASSESSSDDSGSISSGDEDYRSWNQGYLGENSNDERDDVGLDTDSSSEHGYNVGDDKYSYESKEWQQLSRIAFCQVSSFFLASFLAVIINSSWAWDSRFSEINVLLPLRYIIIVKALVSFPSAILGGTIWCYERIDIFTGTFLKWLCRFAGAEVAVTVWMFLAQVIALLKHQFRGLTPTTLQNVVGLSFFTLLSVGISLLVGAKPIIYLCFRRRSSAAREGYSLAGSENTSPEMIAIELPDRRERSRSPIALPSQRPPPPQLLKLCENLQEVMTAEEFQSWWPHYSISHIISFAPSRRPTSRDLASHLNERRFFVLAIDHACVMFAAREKRRGRNVKPGDLFMAKLRWSKNLAECTIKAECNEVELGRFLEALDLKSVFR